MMPVIIGLIALSIILDLIFVLDLFPPWRSHDPHIAWLLSMLALATAGVEILVLLATFHIHVPALLALVLLAGKDAALIWRMVKVRQTQRRHAHIEKETHG